MITVKRQLISAAKLCWDYHMSVRNPSLTQARTPSRMNVSIRQVHMLLSLHGDDRLEFLKVHNGISSFTASSSSLNRLEFPWFLFIKLYSRRSDLSKEYLQLRRISRVRTKKIISLVVQRIREIIAVLITKN